MAMADLLMLFLQCIIIIILLFPFLTNGNPRSDIISKSCEEKVYKNGTTFLMNFWEAVNRNLTQQMEFRRWGVAEIGKHPNKAFVMAACYGDLTQEDCNICYAQCRYLIPSCMPRAGGRAYLDGCFIRAANYSFFHETVSPNDVLVCGSGLNEDEDNTFAKMTTRVVYSLVEKATKEEAGGYADASAIELLGGGTSVYAQANCWKVLDTSSCGSCLEDAAFSVLSCLPAKEGRTLKAGCVIHYSDYEFVNKWKSTSVRIMTISFISYVLAATGIAISAICIGLLAGKIIYNRQQNRQQSLSGIDAESSLFKRSLRFKYSTIEKATNNFSNSNKLGQGGFGEVFKGSLGDGREIAVKRLYVSASNRSEEVYHEMNVISQAHHRNLVRFLGCCLTSLDSLLVYEFVPNKSLDLILFDPEKKKEVDWKKRVGIIKGTAEGLAYLHEDCQVVVVHRDIKASNILLDLKFRPKIADFGLARFCFNEGNSTSVAVAGTFGYMAPEYMTQGQLTEKVDVFSYGVLVLEIITGIQNNKFTSDESLETLITCTWKHFKSNTISEIIDESMELVEEEAMEEVRRIVQVGLLCTQEAASLRPTMKEVIQMLSLKDEYLHLPQPSKPPFFDESLGNSKCFNSCLDDHHNDDDQIPNLCKSHSSAKDPS